MPKTNGNSRNQRNNPYQLEELFIKFHHTPAGIAWRWRTELLTLSGLAAAFWRLDTWTTAHLGRQSSSAALAGRGPGRAALPPVHHPAVLVRAGPAPAPAAVLRSPAAHPLRAGSRSSCGPGPPRSGNATWVLCRAGICAEDFDAHIGELRAACYARDARVTRNRRWSQLVTIDIIRRDTLAAGELIASPLARLTAHYPPAGPRRRRRARASRVTRHGGPRTTPGGRPPRPLERRHLP